MGKYIENNLGNGEHIVLKAKKNLLYLLMPLVWLLVVIIFASIAQGYVNTYSDPAETYAQIEWMASYAADYEEEFNKDYSVEEQEALIALWNAGNPDYQAKNWDEFKKQVKNAIMDELRQEFINSPESLETDMTGFDTFMEKAGEGATITLWVLAFLIGGLPFLKRLLRFLSLDLALTNKRVVGKMGIIRINSLDIPIEKVDHVVINAGFFGRILKYYSLNVVSVGGAGGNREDRKKKDLFMGISNAQQFKNATTEAVEKHADDARKAQAEEIARAMSMSRPN